MQGIIDRVLYFFGNSICHQKTNLAFSYNEKYMPVCSRCTGIYIGFIISVFLILLIERRVKIGPPRRKTIIAITIAFTILMADVLLTTYGAYQPDNILRFLTGFFAGWILALIIHPLKNNMVWHKAVKTSYLDAWWKYTLWLIGGAAFAILFILTYRKAFLAYSMLAISGIFYLYADILLIIFFLVVKRLSNRINDFRGYFAVMALGIISSGILLASIALLRILLF